MYNFATLQIWENLPIKKLPIFIVSLRVIMMCYFLNIVSTYTEFLHNFYRYTQDLYLKSEKSISLKQGYTLANYSFYQRLTTDLAFLGSGVKTLNLVNTNSHDASQGNRILYIIAKVDTFHQIFCVKLNTYFFRGLPT